MKQRWMLLTCAIVVFYCASMSSAKGSSPVSDDGKGLFLSANVALSEKRYADAHRIAEELIRRYAGDCQIGLYLRLYANTFYFMDENFQKGMLRPTPPNIQARIEALKAKGGKTVVDLAALAWVGNGPGGDFSLEYIQEILDKYPNSIWADWAEWMLIQEREYRPREKYQDKDAQERAKSLARDLYNASKKFIRDHPDSYMVPGLLEACARWRHDATGPQETALNEEAVRMCYRVLRDYPNAEYDCAEARRTLRNTLKQDYKEQPGCSEETDRIITQFYCVSPELDRQKKYTTEYAAKIVAQANSRAEDGWPLVAYILIVGALAAVATATSLLVRKKSRGSK